MSSNARTESTENYGDFAIDYNGQWFHEGDPINRKALAKLFADRALVIDLQGDYWLKTPFEQYPVNVEDVPFIVVDYKKSGDDYDLVTNMEETVPLGPDHPLFLKTEPKNGDKVPYVEVRDGLFARLGRNVFTDFANIALDQGKTSIKSRGMDHPLGELE